LRVVGGGKLETELGRRIIAFRSIWCKSRRMRGLKVYVNVIGVNVLEPK
jgi:hypothetical protein